MSARSQSGHHPLEEVGGQRDRRGEPRGLQAHGDQRAEPDEVDAELLDERQHDRHDDQHDRHPFERPAQHEDDAEDQQQHRRRRQVELQQRFGDQRRAAEAREHRAEVVRRRDEQQDHAGRQQRRIDGLAELLPRHAPVRERHQQHGERADRARVGRGRDAGEDDAQRGEDDDDDRRDAEHELAHDFADRFGPLCPAAARDPAPGLR